VTTATGDVLVGLQNGAREVLDANWLGGSTLPSRTLYPHQWSWDSAFSFHPDRPDGHVVPTYDLAAEGFDERRYWRGPVWINTNWLLWNGLLQHGQAGEADAILLSSLGLVAQSGFREYFDPFGGEGFGTTGFGWSAALTLDFIHRLPASERASVGDAIGHGS
jgi:hypothetical protein